MRNGQSSQAKDAAQPAAAPTADTIEQVRELLFGHEKRRTEQTFASLQAEMHKSFADMRSELQHQVDALTNRILDLERATEKRRLESLTDIGLALSDLGARVQNMGAEKPRK
jgi:hypothetical protein